MFIIIIWSESNEPNPGVNEVLINRLSKVLQLLKEAFLEKYSWVGSESEINNYIASNRSTRLTTTIYTRTSDFSIRGKAAVKITQLRLCVMPWPA